MPAATPTTRDRTSVPARARRLRRVLAGALLASGAGALGVAHVSAGPEPAADDAYGARFHFSVHSEERRERAVCEHVACPTDAAPAAIPRRESVQRTRTVTLSWSAQVPADATAAPTAQSAPAAR